MFAELSGAWPALITASPPGHNLTTLQQPDIHSNKEGSIQGLRLNINIPGFDPTDLVFSYFPGFLRPVADAPAGQHVSQEQGVDQGGLAQA